MPVKPQPSPQSSNSQNNILIGSLIAGGLIGASVIISQVLTKSSQPITVLPSETPSTVTSPVIESPKFTSTTQSAPSSTSVPPGDPTAVNNYFWLSQRLVTDADLDGKSGFQLDIMRNSIFAVHGRRFDTAELQNYFNNQSWYSPIYSPETFPLKSLSKFEQQNVEYINKYQDRKGLRYFKK
ncbi:MAG: YARHG domain-containing protein [Nostoc sp.]|uniref:YARHG domain-containing protein n=1 Tax=Nostoc sp. TaxID=1180 RepID=UPI002FF582C8